MFYMLGLAVSDIFFCFGVDAFLSAPKQPVQACACYGSLWFNPFEMFWCEFRVCGLASLRPVKKRCRASQKQHGAVNLFIQITTSSLEHSLQLRVRHPVNLSLILLQTSISCLKQSAQSFKKRRFTNTAYAQGGRRRGGGVQEVATHFCGSDRNVARYA